MNCPICGGKTVGKVGIGQYFCWNCFIEYQVQGDNVKIFSVEEDGTLIAYDAAGI